MYERVDGSFFHYDIVRHVMYESLHKALSSLNWNKSSIYRVLEIGSREPTTPIIRILGSITDINPTAVNYPEVDIQDTPYSNNEWDIVIADQVLEHVQRPWLAADEIYRITNTLAIVATPIILGVHPNPIDCWRIMPDGYEVLFPREKWLWIEFGCWGNRNILRDAFNSEYARGFSGDWIPYKERQLIPSWNEPYDGVFPVVCWWIGRKK